MAPLNIVLRQDFTPAANASQPSPAVGELQQQWTQPADVFSILLLLGGEIVNKALAQLAGGLVTPVTFSFGWVSYALTVLLASVGDARLMPPAPDGHCLVINAKSSYSRANSSWVLGRILRDYETWMDVAVKRKVNEMLLERWRFLMRNSKAGTQIPRPRQTGLCIAIYQPDIVKKAGDPVRDLIYWSGFGVATLQLIVSAVPLITSGDWVILMITVSGSILAFVTGSLPQWKAEKWACRYNSRDTYVLTPGNGAQHAIVILGNGRGLNLEDLAVAGQMTQTSSAASWTRLCLGVVSLLWICLLIGAAGVTLHTWYLLAVGAIGILQNVLVAGWRRNPSALGIHLVFQKVIGSISTMDALFVLEEEYPNVGKCMLSTFFPGKLFPEEIVKWDMLERRAAQAEESANLQSQNSGQTLITECWTLHAQSFGK